MDLSRFKVPPGSIVLDMTIAATLLWQSSTNTEALRQLAHRVEAVEDSGTRDALASRTAVLERRADEQLEFKAEVRDQLNRIEDKIDKIADRKQ